MTRAEAAEELKRFWDDAFEKLRRPSTHVDVIRLAGEIKAIAEICHFADEVLHDDDE